MASNVSKTGCLYLSAVSTMEWSEKRASAPSSDLKVPLIGAGENFRGSADDWLTKYDAHTQHLP